MLSLTLVLVQANQTPARRSSRNSQTIETLVNMIAIGTMLGTHCATSRSIRTNEGDDPGAIRFAITLIV